jgi:hypothetical protein
MDIPVWLLSVEIIYIVLVAMSFIQLDGVMNRRLKFGRSKRRRN